MSNAGPRNTSTNMFHASPHSFELATSPNSNIAETEESGAEVGDSAVLNDMEESHSGSSLAPVDGGHRAWTFLAAAFVVETIVWGFPNAYGVFLEAYLADAKYSSQPHAASLLPLIGPLSSGIIYCSGPIIHPITFRYPYHRRTFMVIGAFLCSASLFGASYTTNVQILVALQGGLYAIGGAMLYSPCISYMSEWFVKRRGLANGVIFAGTSTGGLILPIILPKMLQTYGPSKTLRIVSVAVAGSSTSACERKTAAISNSWARC